MASSAPTPPRRLRTPTSCKSVLSAEGAVGTFVGTSGAGVGFAALHRQCASTATLHTVVRNGREDVRGEVQVKSVVRRIRTKCTQYVEQFLMSTSAVHMYSRSHVPLFGKSGCAGTLHTPVLMHVGHVR